MWCITKHMLSNQGSRQCTRYATTRILSQLCVCEAKRCTHTHPIADNGALAPICALLRSSSAKVGSGSLPTYTHVHNWTPQVVSRAVGALHNLSSDPKCISLIREAVRVVTLHARPLHSQRLALRMASCHWLSCCTCRPHPSVALQQEQYRMCLANLCPGRSSVRSTITLQCMTTTATTSHPFPRTGETNAVDALVDLILSGEPQVQVHRPHRV